MMCDAADDAAPEAVEETASSVLDDLSGLPAEVLEQVVELSGGASRFALDSKESRLL